ncbi:MAG: hypothetical protein RBS13_06750, partial [Bacteroidales bacterium]|nr:hypothetical protein [Bacteroidales bacterium]
MSDFSAKILDDILSGKNAVMSSKMSLVSEDTEDDELLDEIDEVDEIDEDVENVEEEVEDVKVESEDEEVLDKLDSVEDEEVEDEEVEDEEVEDEEVLDELDSVEDEEMEEVTSPSEELKAFSKLVEIIDDFIINSDIDFSAHPKFKDFAVRCTEELEDIIDELRQEKNDALFNGGVAASKRSVISKKDSNGNEIVSFAFRVDKGYEFNGVRVNTFNIDETNNGTFLFVAHVEPKGDYTNIVTVKNGKVIDIKPKYKCEKDSFASDVFEDVKKMINTNFFKQKLEDKVFVSNEITANKKAIKADKDYKDVEVETAHLIADCLRNCKEISLV